MRTLLVMGRLLHDRLRPPAGAARLQRRSPASGPRARGPGPVISGEEKPIHYTRTCKRPPPAAPAATRGDKKASDYEGRNNKEKVSQALLAGCYIHADHRYAAARAGT